MYACGRSNGRFRWQPLAAADSPAAAQARLFPGEGVAPAADHRRGRGEERGLRTALRRADAGGLRVAPARDHRRRGRGCGVRGQAHRRPLRRGGARAVQSRSRRGLRRHRQRGAFDRRGARRPAAAGEASRGEGAARAAQEPARPGRGDRFFRRRSAPARRRTARRARGTYRRAGDGRTTRSSFEGDPSIAGRTRPAPG